MINPKAPQIAPADDHEIAPASMTNNAPKALHDALPDDERDWVATVVASLEGRSGEAKKTLIEALLDGREDVMPLLGLEPTTTENTGFNPNKKEDSSLSSSPLPLLGTTRLK